MSILSFSDLKSLFHGVTVTITGLNAAFVRNAYQANGEPGWEVTQDVAFVNLSPSDNPYDKQRDITYAPNNSTSVEESISYTRVMQVVWSIYGPNSFDLANTIRSGILKPAIRSVLSASGVFPLTSIAAPIRAPYNWNGQWWERIDVTALFNVLTQETATVPTIAAANIEIIDSHGVERTIHVT